MFTSDSQLLGSDCLVVLTQSEHTQSDDDLFTGDDASNQSVQNAVIAHKRHHSLCKLGIAGHVYWSAAVKHWQRLAEDMQRSEVRGCTQSVSRTQGRQMDVPGRNRKFGAFFKSLRETRIFMTC